MADISSPAPTRPTPLWALVLIALGILIAGALLRGALWASDPWEGMQGQLKKLPRILFLVGIFYSAISLILLLLLRLCRLQKYRTWAVLAPFIYWFFFPSLGWPTASNRQESFTNRPLPASVREMRTHFSGNSLANYSLTYYFKCSPAETEAFIRDLSLKPMTFPEEDEFLSPPFPGWPATGTWQEPAVFTGVVKPGYWSYCLKTDRTREQVYFSIKCY